MWFRLRILTFKFPRGIILIPDLDWSKPFRYHGTSVPTVLSVVWWGFLWLDCVKKIFWIIILLFLSLPAMGWREDIGVRGGLSRETAGQYRSVKKEILWNLYWILYSQVCKDICIRNLSGYILAWILKEWDVADDFVQLLPVCWF